jgi:hypothetical protein
MLSGLDYLTSSFIGFPSTIFQNTWDYINQIYNYIKIYLLNYIKGFLIGLFSIIKILEKAYAHELSAYQPIEVPFDYSKININTCKQISIKEDIISDYGVISKSEPLDKESQNLSKLQEYNLRASSPSNQYIDPALLQLQKSNDGYGSSFQKNVPIEKPESSKMESSKPESSQPESSKGKSEKPYRPRFGARAKVPEWQKELKARINDPTYFSPKVWDILEASRRGEKFGREHIMIPGLNMPYFDPFFTYYPDKKLLVIENQHNIKNFFDVNGKIIRTSENKAFADNVLHGLRYHADYVSKKSSSYVPMPNLDENATKWMEEFYQQKGTNPDSNRRMFHPKDKIMRNSPRLRERLYLFTLDRDQNKNA